MIDYDFLEYCSGCGICADICPTGAISMSPGEGKFLFPQVDVAKCISCNRCDRVCTHINAARFRKNEENNCGTWLYSSSDNIAKLKSSSGAAFYELSKSYIENDGYVCGCVWSQDMSKAEHIVGNSMEDVFRMQGSKYLQSDVSGCYIRVIELLKQGHKVLFSGTPCQVLAIHNAILQVDNGIYRNSMLTVAVICHGVAAPGAWQSFKMWIEKKNGSSLISANFRDKTLKGYKQSYCRYSFESGKEIINPTYLPSSPYIESTLVYNLAIRRSCSHCDCKGITEGCDLIIGDWYAEFTGADTFGASCVVACTENGKRAAEQYLSSCQEIPFNRIREANSFISESVNLGANRDEFMKEMNNSDFWEHIENLYPPKYKFKKILVKLGLYSILKKFLN